MLLGNSVDVDKDWLVALWKVLKDGGLLFGNLLLVISVVLHAQLHLILKLGQLLLVHELGEGI